MRDPLKIFANCKLIWQSWTKVQQLEPPTRSFVKRHGRVDWDRGKEITQFFSKHSRSKVAWGQQQISGVICYRNIITTNMRHTQSYGCTAGLTDYITMLYKATIYHLFIDNHSRWLFGFWIVFRVFILTHGQELLGPKSSQVMIA